MKLEVSLALYQTDCTRHISTTPSKTYLFTLSLITHRKSHLEITGLKNCHLCLEGLKPLRPLGGHKEP